MKKIINIETQLGQANLDDFFKRFQPVIAQLNKIIETKNGKKDVLSISQAGSNIKLSYKKTEKSNGMFLDVTIKPTQEFDERLEWVIQSVFNACCDNDCYDLVRVYGAKERGHTMGFEFSIENQDYNCILWKRPEVVYIIMRHAEPTKDEYNLTEKGDQQAKEVAQKIKQLFPDEKNWTQNSSINIPSRVLRITITAQIVANFLGESLDNFNVQRCEWLSLKTLNNETSIPFGSHVMTQNTEFKYQFMFTHWDVAQKAFPTFVKDLNLEENLADYKLGLAECIVMYPDGRVVKITPDTK
jgi:hypothetical protein